MARDDTRCLTWGVDQSLTLAATVDEHAATMRAKLLLAIFGAILWISLGGGVGPASAGTPAAAPPAVERAKALRERGYALLNGKDYAAAKRALLQAHALDPTLGINVASAAVAAWWLHSKDEATRLFLQAVDIALKTKAYDQAEYYNGQLRQMYAEGPKWATDRLAAVSQIPSTPEAQAAAQRTNELYAQVMTLRGQGNLDAAAKAADEEVDLATKDFGEHHPSTLVARGARADILMAKGQADQALASYEHLVDEYTRLLGAQHPSTLTALNGMATCDQAKGARPDAEKLFLDLIKRAEQALGANHASLATYLNNLGAFYSDGKEFAKAVPVLERALRIQGVLGAKHPDRVATLVNLGLAHRLSDRPAQARPYFEEALTAFVAIRGANHQQTQHVAQLFEETLVKEAGGGEEATRVADLKVERILLAKPEASLEEVDAIWKLQKAEEAYLQGKTDDAIKLGEAVLAYRRRSPGNKMLDLALAENDLAAFYEQVGKFGDGERLLRDALSIRERSLGPENAYVGITLINLGSMRRSMGDAASALPFLERAARIYEKAYGSGDVRAQEVELRICEILDVLARYDGVEGRLKELIRVLESQSSGAVMRATAVDLLARVQLGEGHLEAAEASSEQAVALGKQFFAGKDAARLIFALLNRANVLGAQGRHQEAAALEHDALDMADTLHASDAQRLVALQNAGKGAMARADMEEAERLLGKAIELMNAHPETSVSDQAAVHAVLGHLYRDQGRMDLAREHLQRAMDSARALWGDDNPNTAYVVADMADVLALDYKEGWEELYERATKALEKRLGPDAIALGDVLARLAFAAHSNGKEDLALKAADRAVTILGAHPGNPSLVPAYAYRAAVLRTLGRLDEAEKSAKAAIDALSPYGETRALSSSFDVLASIQRAQGRTEDAVATLRKSVRMLDRLLKSQLATGSGERKMALASDLDALMMSAIALHDAVPGNRHAAELAAEAILAAKARALDAEAGNYERFRQLAGPDGAPLLEQLSRLRAQQMELMMSRPAEGQEAERASSLKALKDRVEVLEAQIAQKASGGATGWGPVTIDAVRAHVPADTALVEVALHFVTDAAGRPVPSFRYAAYVVDSSGLVGWADLGPAEPVHKQIDELRSAIKQHRDVKVQARALYDTTLGKLAPWLHGKAHLLISPSGRLALVPFEALLAPNNRYVIEDERITYLSTGRDLIEGGRASGRIAPRPDVIVANPAFDSQSGAAKKVDAPLTRGAGLGALVNARWNDLPGTAREAERITPLLPGASVLSGEHATKEAFKALDRPRILHVATHGFFLGGQENGEGKARGLVLDVGLAPAVPDAEADPMLASGLVFAGANRRDDGRLHDGYLTAAEIATMNLVGTELVVLSACETGLGAASSGEGVFGLRRAIALAGARSQVISLWQVSDDSTSVLMESFYRSLGAGGGVSGSLRDAQLEVMHRPGWEHPYFWAAFISSGDWSGVRQGDTTVRKVSEIRAGGCAHCGVAGPRVRSAPGWLCALFAAGLYITRSRKRRRSTEPRKVSTGL